MNGELAKKWLGKLTKLNAAAGRGKCRGKASHKPLRHAKPTHHRLTPKMTAPTLTGAQAQAAGA